MLGDRGRTPDHRSDDRSNEEVPLAGFLAVTAAIYAAVSMLTTRNEGFPRTWRAIAPVAGRIVVMEPASITASWPVDDAVPGAAERVDGADDVRVPTQPSTARLAR